MILGFCRPWTSAQDLLMATIYIQIQCQLLWIWLWCLTIMLMMSPSHSHHSLEAEDRRRDRKVGKYCGDSLLGYEDDGEWVVCGRRGGGRTSSI